MWGAEGFVSFSVHGLVEFYAQGLVGVCGKEAQELVGFLLRNW